MDICTRILACRKKAGLTQEGLAEKTGVTRQAVAKWESGESVPELEKLIILGSLFQISLDTLIKGPEPCSPQSGEALPAFDLAPFLCRAKKAAYAGKGPERAPSRLSSHDLSYEEKDLFYLDSYFGGERFTGEETLFQNNIPLWAMNYTGRVLSEDFSGDFLKQALLEVAEEEPYRGPALFRQGEYTYQSRTNGDFGWFHGEEAIYIRETLVYECRYHGGIIR